MKLFMSARFGKNNGAFFDHDNDRTQNKWIRVPVEDTFGEKHILIVSDFEAKLLVEQFAAIRAEHGWE